jgi:hypothetical protein
MEGHDIAMIVPPPHNQRHHSYLQRYITTEQPKIVGKGKQQIVGIHKVRQTSVENEKRSRPCRLFNSQGVQAV